MSGERIGKGIIRVHVGAFTASHPDYGKLIGCFICGALRPAYGLAHVSHNQHPGAMTFPLCEACMAVNSGQIVYRKLFGATEH